MRQEKEQDSTLSGRATILHKNKWPARNQWSNLNSLLTSTSICQLNSMMCVSNTLCLNGQSSRVENQQKEKEQPQSRVICLGEKTIRGKSITFQKIHWICIHSSTQYLAIGPVNWTYPYWDFLLQRIGIFTIQIHLLLGVQSPACRVVYISRVLQYSHILPLINTLV